MNVPLDISEALATVRTVTTVEILGSLEPEDVAAALAGGRDVTDGNSSPPPQGHIAGFVAEDTPADGGKDIKRLREKHHSTARLIASGMTQRMVAQLVGYTEGYLSVLLGSPAMQELITLYRSNYIASSELMTERLHSLAGKAVDELHARMEETPGEIDVHALIAAAKLGLDRSGHGPTSHQNIREEKHIFDHAELVSRDRAARNESKSRVVAPPALPAPADAEADTEAEPRG